MNWRVTKHKTHTVYIKDVSVDSQLTELPHKYVYKGTVYLEPVDFDGSRCFYIGTDRDLMHLNELLKGPLHGTVRYVSNVDKLQTLYDIKHLIEVL